MQTVGLIVFILFAGSAAIWLLGSITLRVAGVVFIVAGLGALVPTSSSAPGPGLFCLGFGSVCWLSGHLLYARQHHGAYRSPIAARIARQLLAAIGLRSRHRAG